MSLLGCFLLLLTGPGPEMGLPGQGKAFPPLRHHLSASNLQLRPLPHPPTPPPTYTLIRVRHQAQGGGVATAPRALGLRELDQSGKVTKETASDRGN